MTRTYLDLTAAEISETIRYEATTGGFFWLRTHSRYKAGGAAGRKAAKNYRGVTLNGTSVLCHRLAWFISHGEWPSQDIDHINGDRADNRIENLRHGSRAFNMQNLRKSHVDCASQLLGAYFDKRRGLWFSRISKHGKSWHLGYFDAAKDAASAYLNAKRAIHEGCTI